MLALSVAKPMMPSRYIYVVYDEQTLKGAPYAREVDTRYAHKYSGYRVGILCVPENDDQYHQARRNSFRACFGMNPDFVLDEFNEFIESNGL